MYRRAYIVNIKANCAIETEENVIFKFKTYISSEVNNITTESKAYSSSGHTKDKAAKKKTKKKLNLLSFSSQIGTASYRKNHEFNLIFHTNESNRKCDS